MRKLNNILIFLFEYNAIHCLIIPSLVVVGIEVFRYIYKNKINIAKKAVLYPVIFAGCWMLSYMVYRTPIFQSTVTVDVEKGSYVAIEEVNSQYRVYSFENEKNIDGEGNIINIPVGRERNIIFRSGPQYGNCMVKISSAIYNLELNSDTEGSKICEIPDSSWTDILKEYLVKLPLCLFVNWIFAFGLCRIICKRKEQLQSLVKNNQYGILIFLIFFVHFFINRPDEINDWVACWYALDYSKGFGSRFFIGTVLSLFYEDYLYAETAYKFCSVFIIFLIGIVSYLFNSIIKTSKDNLVGIIFLIGCYIACPGSIASLWTVGNYGRLEMYTLLLTLLGVMGFCKIKNIYGKYLCITVITIISCAIYQGYIFLYFPIFLMIMIYDIVKEDRIQIKNVILSLLNCLITCINFLVWSFCTDVPYKNAQSMLAAIKEKTDLTMQIGAIEYEFFSGLFSTYNLTMKPFLKSSFGRERVFITVCLLMPLIIMIFAIYFKCFSDLKKNGKKVLRSPHIYFLLSNLAIIPQFLLNIDWERWLLALIIDIFFGILYLNYMENKEIESAIKALGIFVERHKVIGVLILLYFSGFDKFQAELKLIEISDLWFIK